MQFLFLKANQNGTSPLLLQLILLFFYSSFSYAHMKCETIALNILAPLAETLNVASFITLYDRCFKYKIS